MFSDSEVALLPKTFDGTAVPVKPDEKLYDLGKENNWARWRALARGEYDLGESRSRSRSWNDQYVTRFLLLL
jgi:hypothetical protein